MIFQPLLLDLDKIQCKLLSHQWWIKFHSDNTHHQLTCYLQCRTETKKNHYLTSMWTQTCRIYNMMLHFQDKAHLHSQSKRHRTWNLLHSKLHKLSKQKTSIDEAVCPTLHLIATKMCKVLTKLLQTGMYKAMTSSII